MSGRYTLLEYKQSDIVRHDRSRIERGDLFVHALEQAR